MSDEQPTPTKICPQCRETKPVSSFSRNRTKKDGLGCQCKQCNNTYKREWGRRPEVRQGRRDRYKREEVRSKILAATRTPEFKAAQKVRDKNYAARKRLLRARPETKAQRRDYAKRYNSRPEVKIRKRVLFQSPRYVEKKRQRKRLWVKTAAGKAAIFRHDSIRRARKKSHPIDWNGEDRSACLAYWSDACATCGTAFGIFEKCHFDHWVPLSRRDCIGTVPRNMLCLCGHCNVSKNNRDAEEWLRFKFPSKADSIMKRIAKYFSTVRQS